MKLLCEQKKLKGTLAFLTRGKRGNDILPMELKLEGDVLTLCCSDGILYASAKMQCVGKEDGIVTVDGVLLNTCVKSLPSGDVSIGGKKRLRVASGKGKRVRNVATLSEDYGVVRPVTGDEVEFDIQLKDLLAAIESVGYAIGDGADRPILQNLFFSTVLGAVGACDGLRSAFATLDNPPASAFTLPYFTVPTFKAMLKLGVDKITVRCTPPGWLEFDAGDFTICAATYAGVYPSESLERMATTIPAQPNSTVAYLPKSEWLPVLRLAKTYADAAAKQQVSQVLTITLDNGTISFDMEVTNVGDMKDTIAAEVIGDPVSVGVHPTLLLQAINNCPADNDDASLAISIWDPTRPFMLQCEGWMSLTAPMVGQAAALKQAEETAERIREQAEAARPPWNDDDGDF